MNTFYEKDDGSLTDEQIALIRKESSASQTPDSLFSERLYELE